jgi:hypothetical protein
MCDFDNLPGTEADDLARDLRRSRRFTLHQKNVGRGGDIVTHWSSGPGNYTYDPDCWWCNFKNFFWVCDGK